jgi:ABC-type polar amino acid transport system ATPase subunit
MIRFESVHKWYGTRRVLDDVSLQVPRGTLHVLCGESGAGKSTLLAATNGLEPIQRGAIYLDGVPLPSSARELRAVRRWVGFVFQSYNLFGHLTVEQNIRLGLERSLGLRPHESIPLAHLNLERVGLLDKKSVHPAELSGGEQQRVAIARCLAMRPKILLMDEPTAALDIDNAAEVVATIRALREQGMTLLLATHQIAVYADLADEVSCLENGRIVERGKLSDFRRPEVRGTRIASWLEGRVNRALGSSPAIGEAS